MRTTNHRPRLPWSLPLAAVLGTALLLSAPPAPSAAQSADTGAKSADKIQVIFSHALPNVPGKTLTAVTVDYAPGGKTPPHHHAGVVLAYVVSGEIRSKVDEGPARVYHAGETFFEPPGSHHLVSENASTTKRAKLLAIFVADDGADLTKFDQP
jgi:quercetin dioxygenase-like cupin family protein